MKKLLLKIAMGLFLVAAIAVNVFPLLASSSLSPAEPADHWVMFDDPATCLPLHHWSHCIPDSLKSCDVSAQHEECEKDEEIE